MGFDAERAARVAVMQETTPWACSSGPSIPTSDGTSGFKDPRFMAWRPGEDAFEDL
ncbi:hypothetical protein ACFXGG_04945 [Streptomyces nigra]|uniref:hypothetical protein n=1 Tax=Streptomyces nigra TaxID=1827580 RepID=UPI0036B21D1A